MKTFYETYKFLLLELSFKEVAKLMDSEKFKQMFTDAEHLTFKTVVARLIPNDIKEKDKANALNWIISSVRKDEQNKQYIMKPGNPTLAKDLQQLKRYLELFYQIKQQNLENKFLKYSAIERYNTFREFIEDLIKAEGPYREYNAQKIERSRRGEGQLLVHEDDNWRVYFPQTKGAACSLGKGTDWCTAGPGLDYYEDYASRGQLIVFISKKDPNIKYQLHYPDEQYMDLNDEGIGNRVSILNKIILDNIIGSEFEKYLSEEERKKILELATNTTRKLDDTHSLVEGVKEVEEEGVFYSKEIVNSFTLEQENPYSPTYSIIKALYDEDGENLHPNDVSDAAGGEYYYKLDRDHPDNPDKITQINVRFDLDFKTGKEKIKGFTVLKAGGKGSNSYPPEKISELSRFMTLGVDRLQR